MEPLPYESRLTTEGGPAYQLYPVKAVTLATFLGTPAAGSVVLAINYRRLGNPAAARMAVICGCLAALIALAIAFMLPDNFPGLVLVAPQILSMHYIAKALQGQSIDAHQRLGGKLASMGRAALIGLIGMVITLAAIAGPILAIVLRGPALPGQKVMVTPKQPIYCSGSATQAEAQKVWSVLQAAGFSGDGSAALAMTTGPAGTEVSIMVKDGAWDRENVVSGFRALAVKMSLTGLPRPVVIKLCDTTMAVRKEIPAPVGLTTGP